MLTTTPDDTADRVAPDGYSLERQRAIAGRRLADTREQARRAREEFEILEATGSRIEVIRLARARFEAAEALWRRQEAIVRRLDERMTTRDDRYRPTVIVRTSGPSSLPNQEGTCDGCNG